MRILMWHVDSFTSTITEKGRSKYVEEPTKKDTYVEDALIVFTAVEKRDEETAQGTAQIATDEIANHAEQIGVSNIVVHPFAHLFTDLGSPKISIKIMDDVNGLLNARGYHSIRTPFGWFNKLEIKAKGHPLSRVAREITTEKNTE